MDYNPNFYLCPQIMGDDVSVREVKKYIVDALQRPNRISNVRYMIVSEAQYTTVGIVCDLHKFVAERRPESYDKISYTEDSKSRRLVSFIGFFYKNSEADKSMVIKDFEDQIISLFEKYIADDEKWFSRNENHYIAECMNLEMVKYEKRIQLEEPIKLFNRNIYASNVEKDKELFEFVLSKCYSDTSKVRLCTDYYGIESIENSVFHTISSKYAKKIIKSCDMMIATDNQANHKGKKSRFQIQKKNKCITIAIIVVILIIIVLIIVSINGKERKQVSKIDMNKPGAHEVTAHVDTQLRNDKAESLLQYMEACNQLVMKYKPEIDYIENKLSGLIVEREIFYKKTIPGIKKSLEKEGIPKELITEWIINIEKNGNKSFEASERILCEFADISEKELKEKIKEIINA